MSNYRSCSSALGQFLYVLSVEPVVKKFCSWANRNVGDLYFIALFALSLLSCWLQWYQKKKKEKEKRWGWKRRRGGGRRRRRNEEEETPVSMINFAPELSETSHTLVLKKNN